MTILTKAHLEPLQNHFVSNFHFMIEDVLDDDECKELSDLIMELGTPRDTSLYSDDGFISDEKEMNAARSDTWLYDHDVTQSKKILGYLEGFFDLLSDLNNQTYQFDVEGISPLVSLNVMHVGGGVSFHRDMSSGLTSTIKLVAVVGLNDEYSGGDFVIFGNSGKNTSVENVSDGVNRIRIPKGGCVIMPSHVVHAVDTVTSGIRKTAVLSLEGKPFK